VALSRGWKIGVIAVAVAGTLSTPAVWQLGNPDAGQLVGASIQGASGLAALVWAMLQPAPASAPAPVDTAIRTGTARATSGGKASTGVRHHLGAATRPARAERTGDAIADGPGSHASTGVDLT
jgi:hypothetical protein